MTISIPAIKFCVFAMISPNTENIALIMVKLMPFKTYFVVKSIIITLIASVLFNFYECAFKL